ncbi:MAG: dihydroorotase [Candidatus Heimdallarchaeota archaeon]
MLLKNAAFWSQKERRVINGHILIDDHLGVIRHIASTETSEIRERDVTIDLKGKLVLPSLVDIHCHLRDFEESHKETYATGAVAAAAGGFTTVFDMPNKKNPVNSSKSLKRCQARAEKIREVSIKHFALLTKSTELSLKINHPYYKAYLSPSTGGYQTNTEEIEDYLLQGSGILSVHCEDPSRIMMNEKRFGKSLKAHVKVRDARTEVIAVRTLLGSIPGRKTRVKPHAAHISVHEALHSLQMAGVSFEVTPHHLFLNIEDDYERLGAKGKMNPPLRKKIEQERLLSLFLRGEIPIIATDHAPHTLEEKNDQELAGIPNLETCLPLILTKLNPLTNSQIQIIVESLAVNPRKLMGLQENGIIAENEPANLVVVDLKNRKKVKGEELETKCKWSPWEGESFLGWPVLTINQGKVTFEKL